MEPLKYLESRVFPPILIFGLALRIYELVDPFFSKIPST
jgi:hypothetical protein